MVNIEMAATPLPTIANPIYDVMTTHLYGGNATTNVTSFNLTGIAGDTISFWTGTMFGDQVGFLLIFVAIFAPMWIVAGDLRIPALLGIIFAGIAALFLPSIYFVPAMLAIGMGMVTLIYQAVRHT